MPDVSFLIEDLVAANRILAAENVVDAFGHVSVRHPVHPDRYFLSRARSPSSSRRTTSWSLPWMARRSIRKAARRISSATSTPASRGTGRHPLGGTQSQPGRHSVRGWRRDASPADAQLRADRRRGPDLGFAREFRRHRPFSVEHGDGPRSRDIHADEAERALAGARFGCGGTLAPACGFIAIALQRNAELQAEASRYENVIFLSPGEIEKGSQMLKAEPDTAMAEIDRAWEYWCHRAGVPFRPQT